MLNSWNSCAVKFRWASLKKADTHGQSDVWTLNFYDFNLFQVKVSSSVWNVWRSLCRFDLTILIAATVKSLISLDEDNWPNISRYCDLYPISFHEADGFCCTSRPLTKMQLPRSPASPSVHEEGDSLEYEISASFCTALDHWVNGTSSKAFLSRPTFVLPLPLDPQLSP